MDLDDQSPDVAMDVDQDYGQDAQQAMDQTGGTFGGVGEVPVGARKTKDKIEASPFAPAYKSEFTITATGPPTEEANDGQERLMQCLRHVNCSYLSTPGRAPTLLELKKHAHSLTVLIKEMTLSTHEGIVDNQNLAGIGPEAAFHQNESFDWLNNLENPYGNEDRHHQMPLTTLANIIEPDPLAAFDQPAGEHTVRDICPLYEAYTNPDKDGNPMAMGSKHHSQPYATRLALIKHANEALEYLDHEYSAKGGLTAIVPSKKEDPEQYKMAESTILGQLILYNQRLVQRLHDLERLYADSMDILAGEANAPHQILSRLGPDGRKPRDIVYPQDRFVLVNAGDDVWQYLHNEFAFKEVADIKSDEMYRALGTTGEKLWEKRGGVEFAKGITAIDVVTRYYRLRNDPLKTVFVIPAYQKHPGTKVTREFMRQPTVVSVVKPLWPERVSTWEQKKRAELTELKQYKNNTSNWAYDKEQLENEVKVQTHSRDIWREKFYNLQADKNFPDPIQAAETRAELTTKLQEETQKAQAERQKYEQQQQDHARTKAEAENLRRGLAELKQRKEAEFKKREAALVAKEKRYRNADEDVGRTAKDLHASLQNVWEAQILETLEMNLFLKSRMPANQTIPQYIKEQARQQLNGMDFGNRI